MYPPSHSAGLAVKPCWAPTKTSEALHLNSCYVDRRASRVSLFGINARPRIGRWSTYGSPDWVSCSLYEVGLEQGEVRRVLCANYRNSLTGTHFPPETTGDYPNLYLRENLAVKTRCTFWWARATRVRPALASPWCSHVEPGDGAVLKTKGWHPSRHDISKRKQ